MAIKRMVKTTALRLGRRLVDFSRFNYPDNYTYISYSQEGEDLVLHRLLGASATGFYVDVGAHHPRRFSNTYFFYQRGWSGLNIDATPYSMREFIKDRPRDINVEAVVANLNQEILFFMFSEPALNTFNEERASALERSGQAQIVATKRLETRRLAQLLDAYLPALQTISFLTVDVEGADLSVLQSSDWSRYRPRFVLAECLNTNSIEQVLQHGVVVFLGKQGYRLVAKTFSTVFFEDTFSERAP